MAVTLRDIAKHLNLSHATVSFVLNERHDVAIPDVTRQRVFAAAKEMGYRPNRAARALVMGRTQMVALWIPSPHHEFYGAIFRQCHELLQEVGYETVFCEARLNAASGTPFNWPVDGIVGLDVEALVTGGQSFGSAPLVSAGIYVHGPGDYVKVSLREASRDATQHLIDQGCKRIGFIAVPYRLEEENERYPGYCEVMQAAGLKTELIGIENTESDHLIPTLTAYFKENGVPDGLFCRNDRTALATLRVLANLGKSVPGDVAVVGCDGIEFGDISVPTLSTIVQPIDEMCRTSIKFLVDRMKEPNSAPQTATLTAKFVPKQSSLR